MICSPVPAPSPRSSSSSRRCPASSRPEQDLPQVGLLNLAGGEAQPQFAEHNKGSSPLFSQLLRKLPSSHSSGFLLLTQRLFLEKIVYYYFSQIQFSTLYWTTFPFSLPSIILLRVAGRFHLSAQLSPLHIYVESAPGSFSRRPREQFERFVQASGPWWWCVAFSRQIVDARRHSLEMDRV